MCESYQLSDRADATIAISVLEDLGLIHAKNRSLIYDYHELEVLVLSM